jgi:voltage-gated sodium channel
MNARIDTRISGWRHALLNFVESGPAQKGIVLLILINAVTLGLETSKPVVAVAGDIMVILDNFILAIFVVEITLRILGHGWSFFRDPWSVFDFSVVAIGLTPTGGNLEVLRSLRILRVLRLFSMIPQMRAVISALLSAVPGLVSIVIILLILYYVFAVIATNLFGAAFPEWFGSIGKSMYSLFQIMTLESWSMGIVRPVMEVYPYAWTFFIPYILIATFTMLNLFIAIIVSAMQTEHEAEQEQTISAVEHAADDLGSAVHSDIQQMRVELRELRLLIERQAKKEN